MPSRSPKSPWRTVDPLTPCSGTRGAKGVSAAATGSSSATRTPSSSSTTGSAPLDVRRTLAGAIHDVLAEEAGIWVTCTNADLLARFTWDGVAETWSWRDDAPSCASSASTRSGARPVARLPRPRVLQSGVTNIGHVNGVARGSDGLLVTRPHPQPGRGRADGRWRA